MDSISSRNKWATNKLDSSVLRTQGSFRTGREEYDIGGANISRMASMGRQSAAGAAPGVAGEWVLEVRLGIVLHRVACWSRARMQPVGAE